MALTKEVRDLRRKFEFSVNSNGNSTEITGEEFELPFFAKFEIFFWLF